jgi:hypothetical protein
MIDEPEEPIYEFIRGTGWIPTLKPQRKIYIRGRNFWLLDRNPRKGELYRAKTRGWGFEDPVTGGANLDAFERLIRRSYGRGGSNDAPYKTRVGACSRTMVYVTLVPCDE